MDESFRTCIVLFFMPFSFAYGPIITTTFLIAMAFTRFYYVTLLYIAYRVWDRHAQHRGGWTSRGLRHWSAFMRDYFSCRLVIVDPSRFSVCKNYILCACPHGVLPLGSKLNFLSNQIEEELGLASVTVVHPVFFHLPFAREVFLRFGMSAASLENFQYILQKGPGHAIVAWPGGGREMELFEHHSMRVRVASVRGFARLALEHGAQLVPVITFGDNDTYVLTTYDKISYFRRFIVYTFEAVIKFRLPLIFGHGHEGILPSRTPVTTVIGNPIASRQLTNPSNADVQRLYVSYCQELKVLFYANRNRYGYGDVDIEFCPT